MPRWNFWKRRTEEEQQADANAEQRRLQQIAAIEALQNGDLPPIAVERIRKHREQTGTFFSSDLSVNEFLLLKEAGIEPLSQVMGTSFLNTGMAVSGNPMTGTGGGYTTGELPLLVEATSNSRLLAVKRMQQEAKLLGASGVVGVKFDSKKPNIGRPQAKFTAYGTAVKIANYPAGIPPFTSNLSGQEFCQLHNAGYRPTDIIMGCSIFYVQTDPRVMNQRFKGLLNPAPNQEITRYTKGCYAARRKAMARFEAELIASTGDGAVGVNIQFRTEAIEYELSQGVVQQDLLIHFTAIGTAIKREQVTPVQSPLLYIDLRNRKKIGDKIELKEFVPRKP